jgi:glycosyltransferase involved in cell wall biosynthesis
MGAGKVVVGTADEDVYGKGVLNNDRNVILVNLASLDNLALRICSLLDDDQKRFAIGRQAQKTIVDHFSWDSVCQQTLAAYECVIEKKAKRYQ